MNPTINISANVSSTVGGVRQVTKSFEDLRRSINAVGGDMRRLTADDRALAAELERNIKIGLNTPLGPRARKDVAKIGMDASNFDIGAFLDPTQYISTDPVESERRKRHIIQTLGGGTVTPGPGAGGGPSNIGFFGGMRNGFGSAGQLLGGIASRLGGGLGSAAAGGAGAGGGGIAAAAGGALGGLAAGAVLAGGLYMAHGTLKGAQRDEARLQDLDLFYRKIHDVGMGFDELNRKVQEGTQGFAVGFTEFQHYVKAYAAGAGTNSGTAAISGARTAVGFAQAYGMDEGSTASNYGSLSFLQGKKGGMSDRQMAMMVGDTIARSGMWAKADEVLGSFTRSVESIVTTTTNTPDIAAMLGLQGALMAGGNPALAGGGAASMMMKMDSAFRAGGTRGEAGQTAIFQALDQANGGTGAAFGLLALREGGLFASQKSLGMGSNETTNLEAVMKFHGIKQGQKFDWSMGRDKDWETANRVGGTLGLSQLEARAYLDAYTKSGSQGMQATSGLISKLKLDQNAVSPDGFKYLSQFANGQGAEAREDILKRKDLAPWQEKAARSGSDEDVERAIADIGREKTDGERIADANTRLERKFDELGTHLVELTTVLKGGTATLFDGTAAGTISGGTNLAARVRSMKSATYGPQRP